MYYYKHPHTPTQPSLRMFSHTHTILFCAAYQSIPSSSTPTPPTPSLASLQEIVSALANTLLSICVEAMSSAPSLGTIEHLARVSCGYARAVAASLPTLCSSRLHSQRQACVICGTNIEESKGKKDNVCACVNVRKGEDEK